MKLIFQILAILFSTLIFSQTKAEKIDFILKTTGSIEAYKSLFINLKIDPLKNTVDKKESLKLEAIINTLTDDEISKRLSKAYDEVLTENEINDAYIFYNSPVGKKLFNSGEILEQKIINNFKDIENEISQISEKSKSFQENNLEKQVKATVYADREDGFYEVINYRSRNSELEDLTLSPKPSIIPSEFLEIKK
jgi:hypothetical protein